MKRKSPPETLRQAQRWEGVKGIYVRHGLCDRCAAQAAWAHQNHGDTWDSIHPPCNRCAAIVAAFPARTTSPLWRKIAQPQQATGTSSTPHGRGGHCVRAAQAAAPAEVHA